MGKGKQAKVQHLKLEIYYIWVAMASHGVIIRGCIEVICLSHHEAAIAGMGKEKG